MSDNEGKEKEDNPNAVATDSYSEKLRSLSNKYLPTNVSDNEEKEKKDDEK